MSEMELITEEYRALQQSLHRNPDYGVASVEYAPLVAQIMQMCGQRELLDYGAGKGRLGHALWKYFGDELRVTHYDPAIPAWAAPPAPHRFVACIDVLEHVEPELLDNVLDDLVRVTAGVGVFSVHTGAAIKTLDDGRNAHLTQQPATWWLPKFVERFELVTFSRVRSGFWVRVEPKREALNA